jgi:hypothetical protein
MRRLFSSCTGGGQVIPGSEITTFTFALFTIVNLCDALFAGTAYTK